VRRAMRTFSSLDNVGVSPVVPSVTTYSTPPASTCSITLASAFSSIVLDEVNGVTSATPVPDNRGIRLLMVHGNDVNNFRFRFTVMNYYWLIRNFIPESHFSKFIDTVINALFGRNILQLLDGLNKIWF